MFAAADVPWMLLCQDVLRIFLSYDIQEYARDVDALTMCTSQHVILRDALGCSASQDALQMLLGRLFSACRRKTSRENI